MQMAKCIPLRAVWDPATGGPVRCLPPGVWWTANFLHILVNFVVFILGIVVAVKNLSRNVESEKSRRTGQKLGLAFVFVLGFLYDPLPNSFRYPESQYLLRVTPMLHLKLLLLTWKHITVFASSPSCE